LLNDYRHLSGTVGIFQHFIQTGGILNDVDIFNIFSVFGIGFTSCRGKGSGIFPINQNFIGHDEFLTENLKDSGRKEPEHDGPIHKNI